MRTREDVRAYEQRSSRPVTTGKPCPVVQELQKGDPSRPAAPYRPKNKGVDGKDHPRFRVSVTLLMSDQRDRDPDGAVSTLMDCLVSARRRLLALDSQSLLRMLSLSKRTGGRPLED